MWKYTATPYPILDFYLKVWKLEVTAGVMREDMARRAFDYVALQIHWGVKRIFLFKLYDIERRIDYRGHEWDQKQ